MRREIRSIPVARQSAQKPTLLRGGGVREFLGTNSETRDSQRISPHDSLGLLERAKDIDLHLFTSVCRLNENITCTINDLRNIDEIRWSVCSPPRLEKRNLSFNGMVERTDIILLASWKGSQERPWSTIWRMDLGSHCDGNCNSLLRISPWI